MELGWTHMSMTRSMMGRNGANTKTANLLVWIMYSWGLKKKKGNILFILRGDLHI